MSRKGYDPNAAHERKVELIRDAVALIKANSWHVRTGRVCADGLRDAGFLIRLAPHTNTIRYRGISATCTWSPDHGLVRAWLAAADRWLGKFA